MLDARNRQDKKLVPNLNGGGAFELIRPGDSIHGNIEGLGDGARSVPGLYNVNKDTVLIGVVLYRPQRISRSH